jgi:mono/diheme cytochrome c family protein
MKEQRRIAAARTAGIAAMTLLLTAPQVAVSQETNLVAEGARVYGAVCGRCHNARSPLERSDRDWVTIMNQMRVRANMTGNQYRAVLAFLQATNTNPDESAGVPSAQAATAAFSDSVSTDPAVIARGESLVQQKACLGCHVIGRAGGKVGPSLNGVVGKRGAEFLRHKLADPTFDNKTSMMPNFGLSAETIDAIVAYLATLNGK